MFNKLNWDPTQRIRTTFTWLWTPTKSWAGFLHTITTGMA